MDKLSSYYTSATNYRDIEGNHRTFTFIDHDVKPKYTSPPLSSPELSQLSQENLISANRQIDKILSFPAQALRDSGYLLADNYMDRTEEGYIWRKEMVREALLINPDLRYTFWNSVWKSTIPPSKWHNHLSYEEVIAGKWKEWL